MNRNREDENDVTEYFMAFAQLAAKRSKDPVSKVGACVVNKNNEIVAIGYNDMPKGCSGLPWKKNTPNILDSKTHYVCHAEMNAILLSRNLAELRDCTMYVLLHPCNECAKLIIQCEIKEVVYLSDKRKEKSDTKAAKILFIKANVKSRQFQPTEDTMVLDFTDINKDMQ